jgi:uncharacterized membrane protein
VENITMTLQALLQPFVPLHVAAGCAALLLFWLAALARKGRSLHRWAGQAYLLAMLLVMTTAIPLVALSWLRGQIVVALFLGYLVVLVALGCRNAWLAIRFRRQPKRYGGPDQLVLAGLVGLVGLLVVAAGLRQGAWILVVFGLIGPLGTLQTLAWIRDRRRAMALAPGWWLKEHFGAMIGNGVATHIAFFQIGLLRSFPDLDARLIQPLAWFLPLGLAMVAGLWLSRRHARRFGQLKVTAGVD